jgi:hypothetical protein
MDGGAMNVVWDGYSPFDPGVSQPLHEVTKREARSAFNRLMAAKDDRIAELRQLLSANGIGLEPTDDGLQTLNDWFRESVEGDPATSRLRPIWYAVVNDLSLYLGEVMIQRCPNLRWVFYDKGSKHLSFQRHVIMGFSKVPNPKYNSDIDLLLATYGQRIVAGQDVERDDFVTWVRDAQSKA